MAARGIVIEIIGDEKSYIRAAENTIATNTKLASSFTRTDEKTVRSANLAADQRIKAFDRSIAAQRAAIAALSSRAAAGGPGAGTAALLAADSQKQLDRQLGITAATTGRLSTATKESERDLSKLTRGALAGSGAFAAMGRSLAFASGGFLVFAVGAQLIRSSVDAARAFDVAQRQAARQLQVTGKTWQDYGDQIDAALLKESHLSGFTRVDLLQAFTSLERVTGNVHHSLTDTALAADVARGRHIALASAANALSKAEGGSFAALRKLNIIIPAGSTKMQALAFVTEKYAGQARSGTTAQDRFNATWVNTQEIIGAALLPTVNRMLTSLGDWLDKQDRTGKLQKNVNAILHDAATVAHLLGGAIGFVDKVTGSFANTLKLLIELQFARIVVTKWVPALEALAAKWGLVASAAEGAAAAEAGALGSGGGKGAAGVGAGVVASRTSGKLASLLGKPRTFAVDSAGVASEVGLIGGVGVAAGVASAKVAAFRAALTGLSGITLAAISIPIVLQARDALSGLTKGHGFLGKVANDFLVNNPLFHPQRAFHDFVNFGRFGPGGAPVPVKVVNLGQPSAGQHNLLSQAASGGIFGRLGGPVIFKSFTDTMRDQLAQARAALTKGTQDDVAAARQEIAQIKKEIAAGHLKGAALIQALQAEAGAISTIQSAQQAAAQQRAAAAQAAKQKILAQIQNAIDPINLQIALAKAQSLGQDTTRVLRKQLAAAYKGLAEAIANGNKQLILQAFQQITALKQQIKDAATSATATFTAPAKLLLDIARDQALGKPIVDDLREEKKALLKWISTHRKNIQGVTDAYNQITAINQQLGSSASSALGLFKQASTQALTEGLGLSEDQRRRLRQRLAGLGPGGTVSGSGVGAAGFAIDPTTGRPIGAGRSGGRSGGAGGGSIAARTLAAIERLDKRPIHVTVEMDGAVITDKITKRQQRKGSRNSSQRRGPNAGYSY